MSLPTFILAPIIVAVVIVVPIVAVAVLNRGKRLKCPDCEHVFKAPLMDQKNLGAGFTFPYLGTVKCPHCGNERSRSDYGKVKQES